MLYCHPVLFQRFDLSFHLKNIMVTTILLLHHSIHCYVVKNILQYQTYTCTKYHMLAQCEIRITIMCNSTNTNLIIVDIWKTMEFCLCWGVRAGLLKVIVQLVKVVYYLCVCIVQQFLVVSY